jgi:hypothetical protein
MKPVAWAIIAAALTGCLGPTTPKADASRWRRVQTEHFVVSSDLRDPDFSDAVLAIERSYVALQRAGWKDMAIRSTERTPVVVLADGLEWEHYTGKYVAAFFTNEGRPTVFLQGRPETWEWKQRRADATSSPLRHELAHRLAASVYGRQPRWFAEGLAQFLETIVVSEDGKTVTLGRINPVAIEEFKHRSTIGVADVLAWKGANDDSSWALYGVSWMLFHWLYNTHGDAFAAFQVALAKGGDPDKAWKTSFPDLTPTAIDDALVEYSRHGEFHEVVVDLPPVAVATRTLPITEADVHAIHAQLARAGGRKVGDRAEALGAESAQEIEKALALEPGNALAWRLDQRKRSPAERLAMLKKQVEVRPDDGEAWLLLGDALYLDDTGDLDAAEAAYRKALRLLPGDDDAYNELAWLLASHGRAEEAQALAAKAAILAPWNPLVLDTYATVLFELHRCADALRIEQRAVDMLGEFGASGTKADALRRTLAKFQGACAPSGGGD